MPGVGPVEDTLNSCVYGRTSFNMLLFSLVACLIIGTAITLNIDRINSLKSINIISVYFTCWLRQLFCCISVVFLAKLIFNSVFL